MAGIYAVGLLDRVTLDRDGVQEDIDAWSARDALVMKALSLVLPPYLPLSEQCTHLKGHGGGKYAVRQVLAQLPNYRFVLKTDVQSYYASIDHQLLLDRLAVYIPERQVLNLIRQYLRRCAERGGLYWEYREGIALGSSLSPIIGAFFLAELDEALEKLGLFWVRYMDDILVLAPTRWKLRKAVKVVNQGLAALGLRKHPDKTYIGRVEKGFDFLGYNFRPNGLGVARQTVENFVARVYRLYERGREEDMISRLGEYVRRWVQWAKAGLAPGANRRALERYICGYGTAHTALLCPLVSCGLSRGAGLHTYRLPRRAGSVAAFRGSGVLPICLFCTFISFVPRQCILF